MLTRIVKKFNWKLYVKIIFTVAAIAWILSQVDINEVGRYLREVPILVTIICIVIFNLSKVLSALRLNIFFKQDGVIISEKENLKLYYKGMFYNMLLPGGIGGDGYKGYYLHKTLQVPIKSLVRPILWDRITGAAGMVLLISVLINFQTFLPGHLAIKFLLITSPVLLYVGGMVASNLIVPTYRSVFHSTTVLSILNQLLQGFIVVVILHGLQIPSNLFDDYLLVFFVSSLATILPITLGGIGIREFVFINAAKISDIEQGTAVALSVLFFGITLASVLIGSVIKLNVQRPAAESSEVFE